MRGLSRSRWSRVTHSMPVKTHLKNDRRKSCLGKCVKVVVLPLLHSLNRCLPFDWGHLLYCINNQVTEEDTPIRVGPLNRPQGKVLPVVYNKPFQRGPGDVHRMEIVVRWRHNKKLMAICSSSFQVALSAGHVDHWWEWWRSSCLCLLAVFCPNIHRLYFIPHHNYALPIGCGQRFTQLLKDTTLLRDGQITS